MQNRNEVIKEFLRPITSAKIPEGISKIFIKISRIAYNVPICKNEISFSRKNKIRKGSKNRRFFKKP